MRANGKAAVSTVCVSGWLLVSGTVVKARQVTLIAVLSVTLAPAKPPANAGGTDFLLNAPHLIKSFVVLVQMETILLVSRLLLAAVFAVAGVAKLFDRTGSEKAAADFGAPASLAKPLSVALPVVEILAAVLLLPLATAWYGAVLSLALLAVFVAAIVYNLAQGKAPDCHCFGQIHSEPVGWSVLVRNAVLTAIAAFLVFAARETAGASAFAWLADLSNGERMQLVFNAAFVGLLVVLVFNLRKVLANQTILQRQIEILELTANEGEKREVERKDARRPSAGLPVGAVAPDFAAPDLRGRAVTLEHLMMRGAPVLLFFVSPTCQPCAALLPKIADWKREFGSGLSIVFASSGAVADNVKKFGEQDFEKTVLLQNDNEIAAAFRAAWTPGAVLINADGTTGSALATGDKEIIELVDSFRAISNTNQSDDKILILPKKRLETKQPRTGENVPQFSLPSLDGRRISSDEFRGMKTLLLFWRATCPYCRGMIDDLKTWEASGQSEFNLVVVANNEPEIERAREFRSTVLIESNMEVQRLFDYDATPGALVIDENGKIASDIATGADDVFALVGYKPKS